ncbi:MAG TPA: extensin family protein [Pseudorhodoferax sp.]|nr:extensin family protein [Pseudorhodoferax sp.]
MRWILAIVALGITLAAATHDRMWSLPDRHNPWAPLRYADAPSWLTRYKLQRLAAKPQACMALLAETPWRYHPVPDRNNADGCGLRDAIQVQRTSLEIGRAFTLSCPAAASIALWERHVVQPQAQLHFGMPVRRMEHFGSYACRNIAGSGTGRRSEHATANALDVAAFVLQDGRRISLADHWNGGGSSAAFLHAVHRGACDFFKGVLGPDYNQAHHDHFHLDPGPFRICR